MTSNDRRILKANLVTFVRQMQDNAGPGGYQQIRVPCDAELLEICKKMKGEI